ncbi:hypothetical protein [Paenibacillus campi]|uniref:hypothetical protein n=1 Tax=Paenibacillus campi TaxID=3106031 RepID=UPI002B000724|nr:hypothetical protein [Paenibacillus sp. SGZ-1014]
MLNNIMTMLLLFRLFAYSALYLSPSQTKTGLNTPSERSSLFNVVRLKANRGN